MGYLLCYGRIYSEITNRKRNKVKVVIIRLFVFIYKKWIKNLTLSSHTLFQMDQIFYNCNIFMKYKYNALSNKSYSSDWNEEDDSKTETHRTYQKNYIKHLKERLRYGVYLVAKFEKKRKRKNRWYFDLLHGIFTVHKQEFLFNTAKARFDF
mmetsp:Transcript_27698/g.44625  ORF Transcript_27698/g.44625 Transcript_27698/m.44625 type:complete len:152 (-) Transcript_27698:223-678(-)